MPKSVEQTMVIPMVQQIMASQNDPEAWKKDLIRAQIFDAQEAKDLTEREVSLIHQALLVQRLSQLSSDELLQEAHKYDVQYNLSFENDDLQAAAICY